MSAFAELLPRIEGISNSFHFIYSFLSDFTHHDFLSSTSFAVEMHQVTFLPIFDV